MLTEIMISFSSRNFRSLDLTNVSNTLTPHTKFLQLLVELIKRKVRDLIWNGVNLVIVTYVVVEKRMENKGNLW